MLCEHLEEYICRLLPPETAAAFEDHLDDCQACREAVADEQELFRLVAEAALLETPPAVALLPKVQTPESKRNTSLAITLSCLALIMVMSVVLRSVKTTSVSEVTRVVANKPEPVQSPVIELPDSTPGITIPTDDPNIQIVLINAPPPLSEFDTL